MRQVKEHKDAVLDLIDRYLTGLLLFSFYKLRHPKTFQSFTVKTERYRKTFIPYCLRHYQ